MRGFQTPLNRHCERVRAAEHAPRDPFQFLERRHGFAAASTALRTASSG
jgi:hypothetical protein